MDDRQGTRQRQALLTGGAALAVVCVLVATGTVILVKVLGLDSGGGGHRSAAVPQPRPVSSPLPSTASPAAGQSQQASSGLQLGQHQHQHRPGHKVSRGFFLRARPLSAIPMEHIDLIGSYRHHAGLTITVQRREGRRWTNFASETASVSHGTFHTWVMTGRPGPNRFRMLDPSSGLASNAVTVFVG